MDLSFLQAEFADNSLLEWVGAFVITLALFGFFHFLQSRGLKKLQQLAQRVRLGMASLVFETLQKTSQLVLFALAVYVGSRTLSLPGDVEDFLRVGAFVLFCVQCGLWGGSMLTAWSNRYRENQIKVNPGAVTTFGAIHLILAIVIWTSVGLLILDNLGFNVTTLIAGLGIGGVAVALALQGVLGDLFASLFIVIDRTFIVGDFLILDEYMGTVEYIGWKTTRLRSLSGEQIIFSNSNLLSSRIRNYGRMYQRRIEMRFNVSPRTTREQLRIIPTILRAAIESQERTRFDRAHFKTYNAAEPVFEYVYFVESPDFNLYMDIQQNINLFIHERFEQEEIVMLKENITEFTASPDLMNIMQEWMKKNEQQKPEHQAQH